MVFKLDRLYSVGWGTELLLTRDIMHGAVDVAVVQMNCVIYYGSFVNTCRHSLLGLCSGVASLLSTITISILFYFI